MRHRWDTKVLFWYVLFFFLGHQEVMMSPQDFLRSITPGIPQPEDLGLDNFLTIPVDQVDTVYLGVDEDSIFHQLGSGKSLVRTVSGQSSRNLISWWFSGFTSRSQLCHRHPLHPKWPTILHGGWLRCEIYWVAKDSHGLRTPCTFHKYHRNKNER